MIKLINHKIRATKLPVDVNRQLQLAGDVTRVSVMPRKVTVKIGDAENRCGGCRDKKR